MKIWNIARKCCFYAQYRSFLDFTRILTYLKQEKELEGLVNWARRKRVKAGIRHYYQDLLYQTQRRLQNYRNDSKWLVFWAEWVHCCREMLFPPTYKSGFAKKYSTRRIMNI